MGSVAFIVNMLFQIFYNPKSKYATTFLKFYQPKKNGQSIFLKTTTLYPSLIACQYLFLSDNSLF